MITGLPLPVKFPPRQEPVSLLGFASWQDYSHPSVDVPHLPIAEGMHTSILETHETRRVNQVHWLSKVLPPWNEDRFWPPSLSALKGVSYRWLKTTTSSVCCSCQLSKGSSPQAHHAALFRVQAWNTMRDAEF